MSHGGKSDIQQHLNSTKHKKAEIAAASSSSVTSFFRQNSATDRELNLAAIEGAWTYHMVAENHSFRSNDCASKLFRNWFEQKFSCGRTKTEAIVVNVFAPHCCESLHKELQEVSCVTVFTDASNHGEKKIFPVMIRYFLPLQGVHVRILELDELPGETAEIVTNYLTHVLNKNNLDSKIIAFCGDNTNSNFGGAARKGTRNIFHNLKMVLNRDILGVGCAAHIVHNTIKTAADCLPIDVEMIVHKIYYYFHTYTVRVESLKDFCSFAEIEYRKLLGYSNTRWLALMPALARVLALFEGLKSYFLSQERCPVMIKSFFENPLAKVVLLFLHSQATNFHQAVLQVESELTTGVEVALALSKLKENMTEKKENNFIPQVVKCALHELEKEGEVTVEDFRRVAYHFYGSCIEYLTVWTDRFEVFEKFAWILLNNVLKWNDVEICLPMIRNSSGESANIDDNAIFSEFVYVKQFASADKIDQWNNEGKEVHLRWVEMFQYFSSQKLSFSNFSKVVEFGLSLPGTNAPVERVFASMNKIWTSEKTQLKVETLKALLFTKINFKYSCLEFFNYLKQNEKLLKKIHSSEKYVQ